MCLWGSRVILAIFQFYLINCIGGYSESIGYMKLSVIEKTDNAPAFNLIFRIISPLVYIIIVSTIFYSIGLDTFVKNIYWVNIIYFMFRIFYNVARGRALLLNWSMQIFHFLLVTLLSIVIYENFIKIKKNLLPDFSTISNELWLVIIFFIFHTLNRIDTSSRGTKKRKQRYAINKFNRINRLYGHLIMRAFKDKPTRTMTYAIIIFEDFNRPKIVRIAENALSKLYDGELTLGIMQVKTSHKISDMESVKMGIEKIQQSALKAKKKYSASKKMKSKGDIEISKTAVAQRREITYLTEIVKDYNKGDDYFSEVFRLFLQLKSLDEHKLIKI